ncbi:MAG: tyrosine-protein phosphatase [Phycisphaerales bacterium]|jgi:protein tyrosine phosphatase (PTP) superfamily phosphohydrolase (DUF442 family)
MTETPAEEAPAPTKKKRRRGKIALVLGWIVLLAGVVWYVDEGHELFWPKRWGVVQEGAIYRSGEPRPIATARPVKAHGIRTIIDLGAHTPGTDEELAAQETAEELGITRYRFGLIGDATGDPNDYVAALRLINDPANQPVWVHCAAGSERTGMLIALHRVIVDGWDVDRAYDETHAYDHDDNEYLRKMLDRWLPDIERAYRTGEIIAYDQAADGLGGAGRMETNGGRTGPFEARPAATPEPEPESEPEPEGG